ncbi:hypothetical protein [Nocardia macrotermitis]|nr:hypothetical protein [Nocardia macrotermitis]
MNLAVRPTAINIAIGFCRYTLHRWRWADALTDAERIVHDLTSAFVAAVADSEPNCPTHMAVWLRRPSEHSVVVEVRDSPGNADVIARSGNLISATVEQLSTHCGQHCSAGRTVLWAELTRPARRI